MKFLFFAFLLSVGFISLNHVFMPESANADLSDYFSISEYDTYNTPQYSITIPNSLVLDPTGKSYTWESDNTFITISKVNLVVEDRDEYFEFITNLFRDGCNSRTFEEDGFECVYELLDTYKTILDEHTNLVLFDQETHKGSLESDMEDKVVKCYKNAVLIDSHTWMVVGCITITDQQATNPFIGLSEGIALKVLRDATDSFELFDVYSTTFDESLEKMNLKVADFIDFSKTPQYYLDRYNNEVSYKEWFDDNYEGITIKDAIGFPSYGTSQDILKEQGYLHKEILKNESETETNETLSDNDFTSELEQEIKELKEKIRTLELANKKLQDTIDDLKSKMKTDTKIIIKKEIASFVESDKDPQSYIDRYNSEPEYKEWFDDNYSEYESIHEAVGKREPVPNWIKTNAQWWSEGLISEDEFVSGIEYLVKERIIQVD